jgi:hypothetical protein
MKTQDLGLAVALLSSNYNLNRLYSIGAKRFEFEFDFDGTIEDTSKDYYEKKLTVDALTYYENMRRLKTSMYTNSSNVSTH